MRSGYPWDGDIAVEVAETGAEPWELSVRVPGWARGAVLKVNGESVAAKPGDYAKIKRAWKAGDTVTLSLPMTARQVRGHHRVDAVRGAVAIERGPLVYAIEQVDQQPGVRVDDVELERDGAITERKLDLFGGVPGLQLEGRVGLGGPPATLTAIPYFMWANRTVGPMRVWLPLAERD
jgi:DUF1680 family protein